jgi:hypothetical protein
MSINVLVNKSSIVKVPVYIWELEGNVAATHLKEEVPGEVKVETITFTFRRPTHRDSMGIIRAAQLTDTGTATIDVSAFQDQVLQTLMTGWDLKDEKGEDMPFKKETINNLEPSVSRAAAAGILGKISI